MFCFSLERRSREEWKRLGFGMARAARHTGKIDFQFPYSSTMLPRIEVLLVLVIISVKEICKSVEYYPRYSRYKESAAIQTVENWRTHSLTHPPTHSPVKYAPQTTQYAENNCKSFTKQVHRGISLRKRRKSEPQSPPITHLATTNQKSRIK